MSEHGSEAPDYVYDDDYRERVLLADDTEVVLRLIQPTDKDALRRGLEHLSPISRYRRFFTLKTRFSDAELRYLTELDGFDHLAIVAIRHAPDGTEQGIGAARFIRLYNEPDTAEAAIAIVDEMQGKGLGTILLERLSEAAYERDVRTFMCEFLADNQAMVALLHTLSPELQVEESGGGVRRARAGLAPPGQYADARHRAMKRFMAHAAEGALDVDH